MANDTAIVYAWQTGPFIYNKERFQLSVIAVEK